jgi:hypothetical protein
MARINQYPLDDEINLNDKWIGSDGNSLITKNFSVQQLFEYFQQNLSIETSDLTIINNLEDRIDEIETEFTISSGSITGLSATSVIKSYVDTEISGVNQISSEQESQISEAHGWGNHASAGYLTSFTETDPNVPSHVKNISSTDISQWDSSYTNMITGIDITENSDGSVKTVTLVRANAQNNLSNSFTDISETGTGGITDTNFYLSGASLNGGTLNLTVTGASNQSVDLDARYYTESEVDAFNYITLTSISVGDDAAASGGGGVAYDNSNGVFTYTPPDFSGSYLPISGGTLTGNLSFSAEDIGVVGNILNTNGTKILENGSDTAEAWYKGRLIGDITDASLNLIFDSSEGSMHKDLFMYQDSDEEYDIVLGYTAQIDFTNDRSDSQSPIETLTAAKISTWDSLEPIANMYFFQEGITNTFRLRLRRQTDSLSTNTSALIQQGAFMTISVVDDSSDTYTYGSETIGSLNVALNYAGTNGLRDTLDQRYVQTLSAVTGLKFGGTTITGGTVEFIEGTGISFSPDGTQKEVTINFDNSALGYITESNGDALYIRQTGTGFTTTGNGIMLKTGENTYDVTTNNSSNWDTAHGWGNHADAGYLELAANDTPLNGEVATFDANGDIVSSSITGILPGTTVFTNNSPNFGTNTITAGDFILSSDRDLKENIIPLAERKIDVNFKEYNFKGSKRTRFGVIAQELEEKHPEFIHTRESGEKSVSYIDLLVAKVHELENRIKELENGSTRNR